MIFALILYFQTLVPGTVSTYTQGGYTWAGNPDCYSTGFLLQPISPAIDQGALISGFHCAMAGSALNQPTQPDGSYCVEWYGAAPDIGACEFYVGETIPAPTNLQVDPSPGLV